MKILLIAIFLCSALAAHAMPGNNDKPMSSTEFQALKKELIRKQLDDIFKEKVLSRKQNKKTVKKQLTKLLGATYEKLITDTDGGEEAEIHGAVNPADSNNIVISAIKTGGMGFTLPVYYTKNFGKSWKRSSFAPSSQSGGDPIFTYDADGTLYFSWIDVKQSGSYFYNAILFSVSKDGGATWAKADTIFSDKFNFSSGAGKFGDKQWMAVDKSNSARKNTVYTALVEFSGQTSSAIVVRKKLAADKKFIKKSAEVSGSDFLEVQFPSIEADDNGNIHVFFWGYKSDDMRSYLWHSVSTDGAETFSKPTPAAPVRFPARSNELPNYLPQRFAVFPQFALDRNPQSPNKGNMYAVWCSNDLDINEYALYDEPFHVYFARSADGGNTWSAPYRLNKDTTNFRADHYHPSIDITPKGDVITTWYDGRQADYNTEVNHYTGFSFDGGETFSKNIKVSDEPSDLNMQGFFGIGDYTKTLSSSGYAIPIWADGRENDGNIRIYAAFVPLTAGGATGVIERISDISSGLGIESVYPNPAQNNTEVRFTISDNTLLEMDILDMSGKRIQNIFKKRYESGEHSANINCSELPSGKYFIRLKTAKAVLTQPLHIIR